MLNINDNLKWGDLSDQLLCAGHQIGAPDLLFERIEYDAIEKQIQKLKICERDKSQNVEPVKDAITYNDL